PVYEYPLNNQWIMMDVDDGFVLWTGIWKADIVKMVEAQPELASQIRRVRGGYLKIQGTWLPYEVALRLARRPTFPDTCLAPDQPGYGQVIPSSGRKGKRSKYTTAPAPSATPLAGSETNTSSDSTAYRSHPYSPSSVTSNESPYDSASPAGAGYEAGQQYYQGYYQAMPTSAPGPGTSSQSGYGGRQYPEYAGYGEDADLSRNPSSSSSSRHRYAPYPPSSRSPGPPAQPLATPRQDQYTAAPLPSTPPSQQSHSRHRSPVRDTRYDLPPISTIELPRPSQQQQPGFSLPPITSLQGGDKPDMDASAVLRRLRLDEPGSSDGAPRSREESFKPLYGGGQVPAYPPGPPTYYGDANYQYGSGGPDSRGREGGADPRWSGQSPSGPSYHPGVAARGGSGRNW
ncbi:hypothetical protein FRC01_005349, partial [Tulasnella sp. 417]